MTDFSNDMFRYKTKARIVAKLVCSVVIFFSSFNFDLIFLIFLFGLTILIALDIKPRKHDLSIQNCSFVCFASAFFFERMKFYVSHFNLIIKKYHRNNNNNKNEPHEFIKIIA